MREQLRTQLYALVGASASEGSNPRGILSSQGRRTIALKYCHDGACTDLAHELADTVHDPDRLIVRRFKR